MGWLGLPKLPPGDRVDQLREAVEVIDRLLRERQISYDGTYYQLHEAPLEPAPVQEPRPPLTIVAHGKRSLRVAAKYADVWMYCPLADTQEEAVHSVREYNRLLNEYCHAIGRDPGTVERACLIG